MNIIPSKKTNINTPSGDSVSIRELANITGKSRTYLTKRLKKFGFVEHSGIKYGIELPKSGPQEERTEEPKEWQKLKEIYSKEELKLLSEGKGLGSNFATNINKPAVLTDKAGTHKVLFLTDTHIGSKYTNSQYIIDALSIAKVKGCEMVLHAGDVAEGTNTKRTGHVFECTHYSFKEQRNECLRVFGSTDLPIFAIAGNHDLWLTKDCQANIVEDLSLMLPNFNYLGDHKAFVQIGSAKIQLWHGEDGSSYAHSYRIQKVIESLQGGTKPAIMLMGHTHKMAYIFERNIHAVSGGSVQFQSTWMAMKRLPAHTGFFIIEFQEIDGEVISFTPTFYPLYK